LRRHRSHTIARTGPVSGGSTGLSFIRNIKSRESERVEVVVAQCLLNRRRGFNHFNLLRHHFRATGGVAAENMRAARVVRSLGHAARGDGNIRTMVVALPVPDLGGSRVRSPYHFRARIQPFQAVAAPFPGEPALPSGPPAPRPKRRSARDRRPALAARPSPGARRAAPRPIGCKRQQRERIVIQACQEIVGLFGGGESTRHAHRNRRCRHQTRKLIPFTTIESRH